VLNDGPQKNNKLAFEESVRAITSLDEGPWRGKQEVFADDAMHLMITVSSATPLSTGWRLIDLSRRPS